ncbi:hypothetical protein NDU88_000851 [Pleurodeles waltl]|uniref:Reverse transcriptase domain-containing protein n=1 Tax=Pleurodeles waltl TaxID=8319 RepID=A0AAV7S5R3_PLEWA|nr:hypothetical protein NDU88_000851 [Pleurodeles waltl]
MYRDECNRLLGNTRHYKRLSRDPTIDVQEEITFLVSKGKENNWITDHEASYLIQTNPKIPYFYILPKVHKGKIPPPGRPIVSGIGSALEPLSKFVDFFLQPIVKRIPTYLKDTTHVLLLLESIAFDKSKELLITLDVESLYTNILQEAILEVISNLLDVHMGGSQTQTPPWFILDLAHLALTRNYFKFEDSFFLQTQGTSMGSTFAPSLACLYVDHIERHTILHEDNPYRDQIKLWKRYIDDVLLIWTGSKEEAQAFAIWLNRANPFLTFTMNIGVIEMHVFLEVSVESRASAYLKTMYRDDYSGNPGAKQGVTHRSQVPLMRSCTVPTCQARTRVRGGQKLPVELHAPAGPGCQRAPGIYSLRMAGRFSADMVASTSAR